MKGMGLVHGGGIFEPSIGAVNRARCKMAIGEMAIRVGGSSDGLLHRPSMSTAESIRVVMPRLGESIVEGTLVRWLVGEGDAVRQGQILAEVETDKATSEIPAPRDGVVKALSCPEGETVEVGTVIAELTSSVSSPSAIPPEHSVEPADAPPKPPAGPVPSEGRLPVHRLAPRSTDARGGPVRSSPAVRRLARKHDVDIHTLTGSGRGGRITRDDVLRSLEEGATAPSRAREGEARSRAETSSRSRALKSFKIPTYRPGPQDREVPFSRRRAQMAEHMIYSLGTSAHVATVAEIDMVEVEKARRQDAPALLAQGIKLTFMPYVIRAVARGLTDYPELNATVLEDRLIMRGERNIGVAVDTPEGLVVPVIRRADELGLIGLARAVQELSQRARDNRLTPDDVTRGSFTISNPGRDGNLFGISIIRQPEVGILRIGTIVKRAVVRERDGEDVIAIRPVMYAALSYDHRVIDGRVGNGFLHRVSDLLANAQSELAG